MNRAWLVALLIALPLGRAAAQRPAGLIAASPARCDSAWRAPVKSVRDAADLAYACGGSYMGSLIGLYRRSATRSPEEESSIVGALSQVRSAEVFDAAAEHLADTTLPSHVRRLAAQLLYRQWDATGGFEMGSAGPWIGKTAGGVCRRAPSTPGEHRIRLPLPPDSIGRSDRLFALIASPFERDTGLRDFADCAFAAIREARATAPKGTRPPLPPDCINNAFYLACGLRAAGIGELRDTLFTGADREIRYWITSGNMMPDKVLTVRARRGVVTGDFHLLWIAKTMEGPFADAVCGTRWRAPAAGICAAPTRVPIDWGALLARLDDAGLADVPRAPVSSQTCRPTVITPPPRSGPLPVDRLCRIVADGFTERIEVRDARGYWSYTFPQLPEGAGPSLARDTLLREILGCAARKSGDGPCRPRDAPPPLHPGLIARAVADHLIATAAAGERPGAPTPYAIDTVGAERTWNRHVARELGARAPALLPTLSDSAAHYARYIDLGSVEFTADSALVHITVSGCTPPHAGLSGTLYVLTASNTTLREHPTSALTSGSGDCTPWARPGPSACPHVTVRPLAGADAACASREALRDSVLVAGSLADHLIALGRRAPQRGGIRGPFLLDSASTWNRLLLQALRVRAPELVAPVADSLRRRVARIALNYVERRGDSLAVQFEVGFCSSAGEGVTRFHRVLTRRDPVFREDVGGLIVALHGLGCGPGR